jgi:tetratricopeptide (TPR) repeat protein
MFSNEPDYDRARILEAASRSRVRKRYRKAATLYRRILAVEPSNPELHARLAPLLAATGRHFDAWTSFEACGRTALAEKKLDQAAAIYREAARCLPREFQAWVKLSRIEQQRTREQKAVDVLLEGRQHFRRRGHRPQAIALLRRALQIAEWNLEIVLDLARLLTRSGQESEAQLFLEQLAQRSAGTGLRRVRGAQWRISPTLANTWRWARAALSAGKDEPDLRRIHA